MSEDEARYDVSVKEWIRRTARVAESARDDVAPFVGTTAQERIDALREILAAADDFAGDGATERTADDLTFWRRWMDPSVGRPR